VNPNDTQVLEPSHLWDEKYWEEKEKEDERRTQTERLPRQG